MWLNCMTGHDEAGSTKDRGVNMCPSPEKKSKLKTKLNDALWSYVLDENLSFLIFLCHTQWKKKEIFNL